MRTRIIIIDDEPDTVMIGATMLQSEGYRVTTFPSPAAGLTNVQKDPPDVILLDIRMVGMDGFQVLRKLKSNPVTKDVPVIMLSVHAQEENIVAGLELGADDFVRKPFGKRELLARVRTVLRRRESTWEGSTLQSGPLRLNLKTTTVEVNGHSLAIPPKEFQLLSFFVRREGRVLTRSLIAEQVWGSSHDGNSRVIDVRVNELRKRLGTYGKWIRSLRGIGYRFVVGKERD